MFNTDKLESVLYEEGKTGFRKIIEDKGEGLYVIGLYHYGGWDGVIPLFNTVSDWLALQKNIQADDQKEHELNVKWGANYPGLEQYMEYFKQSYTEVQQLGLRCGESVEELQLHWQQTLDAMQRALVRLDKEGVFSQGVDRHNLTVYISNYDEDFEDGFKRVKNMNPKSVIDKVGPEFEYLIALHAKWNEEILAEILKGE
ncbi:hypothetical protein MNBD_GAMMA09-3598 [hydrothermal vent metagenome]|uniref:Uncharacterized protein n=1 Tax=hydrothermal vent metagenome TaxID=652676 RepID=A0A3B0Y1R2_9ZZZZ